MSFVTTKAMICIKFFSKFMINVSNLNYASNFSLYRRSNKTCVSDTIWNNTWMMSYNIYLLKKYQIYLNVEICISIKSMIYLYKYVFKNFDHVNIFSILIKKINDERAHCNDNQKIVNEIKLHHNVKWIDSYETTWKIFQLFMKKNQIFCCSFASSFEKSTTCIIWF